MIADATKGGQKRYGIEEAEAEGSHGSKRVRVDDDDE